MGSLGASGVGGTSRPVSQHDVGAKQPGVDAAVVHHEPMSARVLDVLQGVPNALPEPSKARSLDPWLFNFLPRPAERSQGSIFRSPEADAAERAAAARIPQVSSSAPSGEHLGYPLPTDNQHVGQAGLNDWVNQLAARAAVSQEDRQRAADDFMRDWPAKLREQILSVPLLDLAADTDAARQVLLGQFELLDRRPRELDPKALEAMARGLIKAHQSAGGDPRQLQELLSAARSQEGQPRWATETLSELGKDIGVKLAKQLTYEIPSQVAEVAYFALATLISLPTGPVSALFTAARLMELFHSQT